MNYLHSSEWQLKTQETSRVGVERCKIIPRPHAVKGVAKVVEKATTTAKKGTMIKNRVDIYIAYFPWYVRAYSYCIVVRTSTETKLSICPAVQVVKSSKKWWRCRATRDWERIKRNRIWTLRSTRTYQLWCSVVTHGYVYENILVGAFGEQDDLRKQSEFISLVARSIVHIYPMCHHQERTMLRTSLGRNLQQQKRKLQGAVQALAECICPWHGRGSEPIK